MSGEYRGSAVTTGYVSSSAGAAFPVQMPADIVSGDILVVAGGGYNLGIFDHAVNPVPPATGWFAVNGPRNIFVKIADGSEAGTLSTEFVTANTSGLGTGTRAAVTAAFCYRFPVAPLTGGSAGPNSWCFPFLQRAFNDTGGSTDSSAHGGTYPSTVTTVSQFRFLLCQGESGSTFPPAVATSMTWSGDLLTDRNGMTSQAAGSDLFDPVSASWADQLYLNNVTNADPHTKVVVGGADPGAFLNGFAFRFAAVPTAPYWGILITPS